MEGIVSVDNLDDGSGYGNTSFSGAGSKGDIGSRGVGVSREGNLDHCSYRTQHSTHCTRNTTVTGVEMGRVVGVDIIRLDTIIDFIIVRK